MIKYKYICIRFIVDKNVKIYKKESSNKLYCKNKINTKNGKKTCMISLKNYIKKRKKLMLLKHNKKQVPKKSSKKKTNSQQNNKKKKTRNTLRGKKYNIIKGGEGENVTFEENITERKIGVEMKNINTGKRVGHFDLKCDKEKPNEPCELAIGILPEYQKSGNSKKLLNKFYDIVKSHEDNKEKILSDLGNVYKFPNQFKLHDNYFLVIDVDASENDRGDSYWERIGLVKNRHYNRGKDENPRGYFIKNGYELNITLGELLTNIEIEKILSEAHGPGKKQRVGAGKGVSNRLKGSLSKR